MIALLAACAGPQPVDTAPTSVPERCEGDGAGAITIAPYLQSMDTESVWILWETDAGTESTVRYGPTAALGDQACGGTVGFGEGTLEPSSVVHEVQLTGLQPATSYTYQVQTGDQRSEPRRFTTPALASAEASFRIVAMGDSQLDLLQPTIFREIIEQGVLEVTSAYGEPDEALAMVLFAGDLVDDGWVREAWVHTFFAPGEPLFSRVPLYPVLGNHEGNSPHYFRYLHLPGNEHHYAVDHGNLRVIGLDSNSGWRTGAQLAWLQERLDEVCDDDAIDFVFVQLHHPWLSELWVPGELDWSGLMVEHLEAFSTRCGKPSIHFYGHTHAYARGATKDHRHLMVNVAGAGGALDRWGEQIQQDHDAIAVSQDEYGFVIVDVTAGDSPAFEVQRYSRGTPEHPRDNELTDRFRVRLHDHPPAAPTVDEVICPGHVRSSAFLDPDGDAHQASEWQVASECTDWTDAVDLWLQDRNEYGGVDLQAGADLTVASLSLPPSGCVRVRHRDAGLQWSAWSQGAPITCP